MRVSDNLKELSLIFPVPLYAVGGAVRDFLLGNGSRDMDLASALSPGEVFNLLRDTEYSAVHTGMRMFTMKILKDGESYEYTAFRKDSYRNDGTHTPESVRLTDDIREDAYRRDFTVNAIYYDIKEDKFTDPTGGLIDLERKILRAVTEPEKVFREDALRIMRMARLASENGLEIDIDTLEAAKRTVALIGKLSKERIADEFNKMLVADTKNGVSDAHIRALTIIDEIGALEYIIPELLEGKGVLQRPDFHKYDVFVHSMKAFEYAAPEVRLAALLHDIAKPKMQRETGKMAGHAEAGAKMTERIMNGLCYSKREVARVTRLVATHMYGYDNTSEKKLRYFILNNYDILDDIIKVKEADAAATGMSTDGSSSAKRLREVRDKMRAEGVPFSVKDLKVDGTDMVRIDIPPRFRGDAMKALLKRTATDKDFLDREKQLIFLQNFTDEKNKK